MLNSKTTLLMCLMLFWGISAQATIRYVKPTASGSGNGSSWANASSDLQAMINASAVNDEVWVAAGTYKPTAYPTGCTTCSSNRDYTFFVKDGVKLYGGFAGTETALGQRNMFTNVTVLSGDIGTPNDSTDNTYHVLLAVAPDPGGLGVTIDGFTIIKGNANVSSYSMVDGVAIDRELGAGIYLWKGTNTISNNAIHGNFAQNAGAGIISGYSSTLINHNSIYGNTSVGTYINNISGGGFCSVGDANIEVTNNLIYNNSVDVVGGGGFIQYPLICNVVNNIFANNTSGDEGLALYCITDDITPGTVSCRNNTFYGNVSTSGLGGAVVLFNSSDISFIEIKNCIFHGNYDILGEVDIANWYTSINVSYCLTQLGSSYASGTGIINNLDPLFFNPLDIDGADNIPFTADDGFTLQSNSPCVNIGTAIGAPTTDIMGTTRPQGSGVDMGAYELITLSTSLSTNLNSTPPFCKNASIDVSYTSTGLIFGTGNVFSVQLSDASGSFASPTIIGALTSTNTSGTITANLPTNQAVGTGYRVRVIASNPSTIGSDNGSNFEIKGSTATASITRNGGILANPTATGETNQLITGCQGTNIVLTAVTGNSGSHKWFKNGVQVGNTSDATYTVNSGWGDYVLIAYDASNCGQATDTIGISLKPTPVANAGTDRNICQGTTTTIGTTAQANTTYTWTPSTHLSSASSANPTVLATLPNTTTYSLRITKSYTVLDANFTCSSANDDVLVTLKPQPAAPNIAASATEVCQGTNISVTATNAVGTIKWYADNALISGANPLTVNNTAGITKAYTAKNLDANGCYSVPSNAVSLIVQNAPTPTITSSVGTDISNVIKVCPSITNAILTANATSGTPVFTWFNPPNANVISTGNTLALSNVSTTSKSYYVKATYTYPNLSCVKQSVTKAIKQDATATGCRLINDGTESVESAMVVYPNPTSNLLNVKVQVAQAGDATLNLVNSLGQQVWSEKRTFNEGMTELQFSLEHLPAGIYHLTLENGDMIQTVKVVKE